MKVDAEELDKYVDPIFGFCLKRLSNRQDAEDLSSEIILHVLSGLNKYAITSLDAWVWRIANNRYARFIAQKNKDPEFYPDEILDQFARDYTHVEVADLSHKYNQVFKYLHTLATDYKNILVDYYLQCMPVRKIAQQYALSESIVKWRLNISRQKIRERISENIMERTYKRINWNTRACNGSMDSDHYLHSQVARAICKAAYKEPLSIEQISLSTGLPTMYIEDELPNLIFGDAIEQIGKKYATNFIILWLSDNEALEVEFAPLVDQMADYFTQLMKVKQEEVSKIDFYGPDFSMRKLGHIAVSAILRKKVNETIKRISSVDVDDYPPRKDGGYGWFIVVETADDKERGGEFSSGCNAYGGEKDCLYYYWIGKYAMNIDRQVFNMLNWLGAKKVVLRAADGYLPADISEEDLARLVKTNLIVKQASGFKLNFACFDHSNFRQFISLFDEADNQVDQHITDIIEKIRKTFRSFVPHRLESQVDQWVNVYANNLVGYTVNELIARDVLEGQSRDKPLVDGVFFIKGDYQLV
jgi:RNA polymerase sigma factor (sigma-70 family)